jgi:drug/metabolite transporter (DMT)-like permease
MASNPLVNCRKPSYRKILRLPLNKETTGIWLGLVGVVIFSMTLPATKLAIPEFGAIPLSFYRATLAGTAALIYIWSQKVMAPHKSDLLPLTIISLLISFVFPISIAIAMEDLPSSHGGIVLGISPLLTALFATLRFGERPSRGFWITALIGSALVLLFSIKESGGTLQVSDLALLLAAISASYGYAEAGYLSQKMGGKAVISWVAIIALIPSLPIALYFAMTSHAGTFPVINASLHAWIALLFLSIFSAYIGNIFWYTGLSMGGISHVGQVQLLQPFCTLALSSLLVFEPLTISNVLFASAVLIVVAIGKRMPVESLKT